MKTATTAEIAEKINAFMDLLRWFFGRGIKINLSPKVDGWNMKITAPESGVVVSDSVPSVTPPSASV
jgi:hypothetical protein